MAGREVREYTNLTDPKDCVHSTTIRRNAIEKGKTEQLLMDITNRLNSPQLCSAPIKICEQVSSSHSQQQNPNSTQQHLRYDFSPLKLQSDHLLPDLNELPLLQELVDTTIIGNASQKGKTKQSLTDITNRLNFPRFSSTPIKSCRQVSSSYSQAQCPRPMQEHNLRYGLSSSNLQKEHLLPDLNEIPLFQEFEDDNIDADIPGHMQSDVQIHDANEDDDVFEDDEVESWMTNEEYWDIGDGNYECEYCGAYFWFEERVDKKYKNKKLVFTLCCGRGKIKLPNPKEPPSILKNLLFGSGAKSKYFRENIRTYNSIFAFTSMGGKVDFSVNKTKGPRTFRLSGQNYHQIGSLLPPEGSSPKFAQLYIYDTENEVENRIHAISRGEMNNQLHVEIVNELKQMLDDNNVLAKSIRMVRDQFQTDGTSNVRLRLIGKRGSDGRRYNLPTVSEFQR
ncbi:uncharacterized protein [Nicotiana sylvestris]|uniref:uncharacterized protein isoform X1 n=1 Tax=Nicotiana sylvestris TaxID=4096 RepID=UPI00388C62A1